MGCEPLPVRVNKVSLFFTEDVVLLLAEYAHG